MTGFSSIFTGIAAIPERSDATPGLWNTRFGQIDANFATVSTSITNNVPFNVKDYGATGNGVTDDTAAINLCFAAAILAAPATILIPPGTYKITTKTSLAAPTNITILGYGATFVLTAAATAGVEVTSTLTSLRIAGLHITGSGVAPVATNGGQLGIGTPIQTGTRGTDLIVEDCQVEGVARSIYFDSSSALTAWNRTRIRNNSVRSSLGTYSGTGYGILLASGTDLRAENNTVNGAQRHGIYCSVSRNVRILHNTLLNHRAGVSTGLQPVPAVAIARSYDVIAACNSFESCEDGCVSIEPHESVTTAETRHIQVVHNMFRNSVHYDVNIGTVNNPASCSTLAHITIAENSIERASGATSTQVPIIMRNGVHVRIVRNAFRARNAYTVAFSPVYLSGEGGAAFTDQVSIEDNDYDVTLGGGGALYGVEVGTLVCGGSSAVRIRHRAWDVTGTAYYAIFDSTLTNTNVTVQDRRADQGIIADRGDANTTLSSSDTEVVLYATPLSVPRAIALPATTGLAAGRRFRAIRTAAATGASALDFGGLKSLAVGQWAVAVYDGAAWRLESFGSL